jgi:hypothetical protein
MENGFRSPHKVPGNATTVRGRRLVETTPEVNREVAESAMLLSQGARRAIQMRNLTRGAGSVQGAPVTAAAGKA